MAHECLFKVLKDLFEVSQALARETFNNIIGL